jgi:hypothetical protein
MLLGSAGIGLLVLRACKGLVGSLQPVLMEQLRLVDKATSLAASKDLAAYQGIMVMDQTPGVQYDDAYNPSDAAEARREAERNGLTTEDLGAEDHELVNLF